VERVHLGTCLKNPLAFRLEFTKFLQQFLNERYSCDVDPEEDFN